jgi:hypothetical protein
MASVSPEQTSLLEIRLALSAVLHHYFAFILSSEEEQADQVWEPSYKAVLLLRLEAMKGKNFYFGHEQGECDYNCQRYDVKISGYEPHDGLNAKTRE